MTYWQSWHGAYADPSSSLSQRLRVVQEQVGRWLDETAPRPVRVLSLCSGDGRDLLEVLTARTDADRVTATLVELDSGLAAQARASARGLAVDVRVADAGDPAVYAGQPPADLVLLCGVLGNISDADVAHVIAELPALCAPGARVIWTRTRREPDLTPRVRELFIDNGFREVEFVPVPGGSAAVGVADLSSAPRGRLGPERLFTFVRQTANAATLAVYEQVADRYRDSQSPAPDWHIRFLDRIAAALPQGAEVLEIGSGTGDDTRYLLGHGLAVQPSDAAAAFVAAMRSGGLPARRLDVLADDLGGPWDAVVAFAMLLHLTPAELGGALERIRGAVRPGGLLGVSVKEGDGAGWSDHRLGLPRYFTYWRVEPLTRTLEDHGWRVEHVEQQAGQRDDWIQLIARRPSPPPVTLNG
ncbi:MAG TPA: class I SAM-dependent methyltransferase [Lapillicoccus sp.]|nr:class I SAM-dependent methyltransferase [Lapillicoccus sp.]